MDDDDDRGYSRAPELQDLLKICASLNEQHAKYILIGGVADIIHGFARGTKDIDFLMDASDENVGRVKRALAVLPDNAAELIADDEIRRDPVVRIADEVVVDLLARASGIDYQAAKDAIETVRIDDLDIPVASKQLLIRTKDTVRPSDAMDVAFRNLRIAAEIPDSPAT